MKTFSKIYSKVLVALLSVAGISCDFYGKEAYGMPPVQTCRATGKVVAPDGKPVAGIRATLSETRWDNGEIAFSDAQGKFVITKFNYDRRDTLYVQLRDVDGEANGSYNAVDILLDNATTQEVDGVIEKNIGVIELDPVTARDTLNMPPPTYGMPTILTR